MLVHAYNILAGFLLLDLFVGHRLFGEELSVGRVWVEHASSSVVDALHAWLALKDLAVLALAAPRAMTLQKRIFLLNSVHCVVLGCSHHIESVLGIVSTASASTEVLVLELGGDPVLVVAFVRTRDVARVTHGLVLTIDASFIDVQLLVIIHHAVVAAAFY